MALFKKKGTTGAAKPSGKPKARVPDDKRLKKELAAQRALKEEAEAAQARAELALAEERVDKESAEADVAKMELQVQTLKDNITELRSQPKGALLLGDVLRYAQHTPTCKSRYVSDDYHVPPKPCDCGFLAFREQVMGV